MDLNRENRDEIDAIVALFISQGQQIFQRGASKKLEHIFHIFASKSKLGRLEHVRIQKYERIVSSYLHEDFKSHFRMSRGSLELLIQMCGMSYLQKSNIGRPNVRLQLQCLTCIWTLANQESYRSVADRFNIAKSTVFFCLIRICKIINKRGNTFIRWPRGNTAQGVIESFRRKKSFPGVLGAIDGCHVIIRPPKENSFAYLNRKGKSSIILQGICDSSSIFIDCYIGFPGSVHDARVFQHSNVARMCTVDEYFPENSHLLGDSAYPLSQYLLTPFRDNGHLSQREAHYNKCHAVTRVAIERAFGLLKARWRRLNYLELHNTNNLPIVISAACMLHNFCMRQKDDIPLGEIGNEECGGGDESITTRNNREGIAKRNYIMNVLQ